MHRELGRDLASLLAVSGLEPRADLPVQSSEPTGRYPAVHDLHIEVVGKAVARRDRPVWPHSLAEEPHDAAMARKLATPRFDLIV
jgi:hypothetical protein